MKAIKIKEEYYYSEDYMDYFLKVNYALIERFKKQLNDEFGTEIEDTTEIMKKALNYIQRNGTSI